MSARGLAGAMFMQFLGACGVNESTFMEEEPICHDNSESIGLSEVTGLGFTAEDAVAGFDSAFFEIAWEGSSPPGPTPWDPTIQAGTASLVTREHPTGESINDWCPSTFVRVEGAFASGLADADGADLSGSIGRKGPDGDDFYITLSGPVEFSPPWVALAASSYQDELDDGGVLLEYRMWFDGDLDRGSVSSLATIRLADGTQHGSRLPFNGSYRRVSP